jgi:tetratricopeptide (TPR) repeat protein
MFRRLPCACYNLSFYILNERKQMSNETRSEELFEQGKLALEVAEFDEAIELFGQSAVEDSTNAKTWFYLGVCYYETRQPELAIEALKRAIEAEPDFADANYLLGTVIGATGNLDKAAELYRRSLAVDPDHHKAEEMLIKTEALLASRRHYRNAVSLIYADNRAADWIDKAARELLQSTAIFKASPASQELARLAQTIIESGNHVSLESLSLVEGRFWANAVKRAESSFDRKSWPEASSNYQEALELSPDHAFIHHALGLVYFALGDTESGVSAWQQTVDIDPEYDLSAHGRIGK